MHVMGHAGVINKKTYISKPRWKEGRIKGRVGKRNASRDALERGTRQGTRWKEGRIKGCVGRRDAKEGGTRQERNLLSEREHVEVGSMLRDSDGERMRRGYPVTITYLASAPLYGPEELIAPPESLSRFLMGERVVDDREARVRAKGRMLSLRASASRCMATRAREWAQENACPSPSVLNGTESIERVKERARARTREAVSKLCK